MGLLIPKNSLVSNILTYVPSEFVADASGALQRARQLLILGMRKRGDLSNQGFQHNRDSSSLAGYQEKIITARENNSSINGPFEGVNNTADKALEDLVAIDRNGHPLKAGPADNKPYHSGFDRYTGPVKEDAIHIVNLDRIKDGVRTYETVTLPFIPREVSADAGSRWQAIPTIARNLPFYQFTGGEKTISFEIDWYADDEHRENAIMGCTKLEAMSLANGYEDDPPRVKLVWGNGDSIFRGMVWIVKSAPYRLTNFSKHTIRGGGKGPLYNSLLPIQAYQTVTLGRVSETNLKWEDIEYSHKLFQEDPMGRGNQIATSEGIAYGGEGSTRPGSPGYPMKKPRINSGVDSGAGKSKKL